MNFIVLNVYDKKKKFLTVLFLSLRIFAGQTLVMFSVVLILTWAF